MLPRLSFVLGGAASGKSLFAEKLISQADAPKVYLATAQAFDVEMKDKIAAHQVQRGAGWVTIEEPLNIADVLADLPDGHVVLVDCATLWLTNVLMAEQDVTAMSQEFCAALVGCSAKVVVVSNEVGHGIVPDNALSRRFRNAQGRLNQMIAAEADYVVNVVAGLPMVLKGALPV